MKVERMGGARAARRANAVGYTSRGEALTPVAAPTPIAATASVLGIPEAEFTPRVRDAIMTLMGEVDLLRRELQQTRSRLEEVERAADQRQLLPLLNRRAFVRELTRYIAFSARYGTPASLVYFDLNGFKQVNDTFSHAAGDSVLAHFADVLLRPCAGHRLVGGLAATSSASFFPTRPRPRRTKRQRFLAPDARGENPTALERSDHSDRASPMAPSSW